MRIWWLRRRGGASSGSVVAGWGEVSLPLFELIFSSSMAFDMERGGKLC